MKKIVLWIYSQCGIIKISNIMRLIRGCCYLGLWNAINSFLSKALDAVDYLYDETEKSQKKAIEHWANNASERELKNAIKSGRFNGKHKEILGRIYKERFR